ncbi:MAG: N-acetyltransferase [Deltaproteobacteria bacterium]|nr:N-acetyltransferase [Deltaproteobacteria bacterium]MBW2070254.1 N-acetyltransferase [Deltaproteobacteria bacterium]
MRIVPVENRRQQQQFIRLPWSIYADDPAWIPPLLLERRQQLSPKNPYFDHARYCSWLAYSGDRPVGRISAQVDHLYQERYGDATGFFGLLEAEDREELFQNLLDTAARWLREQGMHRVLGPFNLSINQECGLLVSGFHLPPSIMMGHAKPYYAVRIEEQGYQGVKDLLAYRIGIDFQMSSSMRAVMNRAAKRVQIRKLDRANFHRDLRIIQDIFEDAWSQNWGFVPFTEEEFNHLGQLLRFLVYDDFVQIAEVDGSPAAMIVGFPNFNEIIYDLNGKLLPWGWLKLLYRLKRRPPVTARVALMGVRRRYHKSLLGGALALLVIDAVRTVGLRRGIKEVELSWILEDNTNTRSVIEALGGTVYKRYRIYGKEID